MTQAANIKQDSSKAIAWVLSMGMHLGLGLIAFLITWSVTRTDDDPPPLITATWHEQPSGASSELPMLLPPTPIVELPMLLPPTPIVELPTASVTPPDLTSISDGIAVLNQVAQGSIR